MRIVAAWICVTVALSVLSGSTEPTSHRTIDSNPRLSSALESARIGAALPAMSVAVFRGGSLVYARGFGRADLASGTPATADTTYRAASVGSLLVAVTALVLAEDGVVDLDADVNPWLDLGFRVEHPDHPQHPISLRALLSHHSSMLDLLEPGQTYLLAPPGGSGSLRTPALAPAGLRALLSRRLSPSGDLHAPQGTWSARVAPGEAYARSDFGIALAAYVLERASSSLGHREGFEGEVRRRVLDPLSMTHTAFHAARLGARPATPYDVWGDARPDAVPFPPYSEPNAPVDGLLASATDLAKLLIALANEGRYGNHAILDPRSVAALRTFAPGHHPDDVGQGLALAARDFDGRTMLGITGHGPGRETLAYFDPRDASGFVLLANAEVRGAEGPDADATALAAMETLERSLAQASAGR